MHHVSARAVRCALSLSCLLAVNGMLAAQAVGPDVIVGDLLTPMSYTPSGGIYPYALGTTSCNIGTQTLAWVSSTNQHPVICQNIYRVSAAGRFEQVGIGWLKHGFTALAENVCATCQNPGTGTLLGVNCSDPYVASLNGAQNNLGPRFEVNAHTGFYPYPYTSPAYSGSIARRCQALGTDIDPALNPGATYLGEGHYVHPVDASFGNQNNNVSYRAVQFAAGTFGISFAPGATTQRTKAAIQGWADLDPSVALTTIDVPGDGRLILGRKSINLGGSQTRFEYALYNMNSDRCASSIQFAMPPNATASNFYFHDVPYHSGEPFNSIDWAPSFNGSALSFTCTETYAQNQNANALRWGTVYNFSFVSNSAPGTITIGLFKPGSPTSVSIPGVFGLDLATLGGGAGNFHLGVDNVPASATSGFCIFSLNTSLAAGAGNIFGIQADTMALLCITQELAEGNIFHWSWPSTYFPAVDIDFPNGSLPFGAGTKADGVAIAFGPTSNYLGATAPVRITF